MPDFDPKITSANLGNVHLDSKAPPVIGTPVHTPDPVTILQGTVAALQKTVTALQTANTALTDRLTALETRVGTIGFVMQGIDPAFAAIKQQIADLHTEYSTHTHTLPFGYESFTFLEQTGDNNKPNFLMPYVWEGTNPGLTDFQRQQNAQIVGRNTSSPQQKTS